MSFKSATDAMVGMARLDYESPVRFVGASAVLLLGDMTLEQKFLAVGTAHQPALSTPLLLHSSSFCRFSLDRPINPTALHPTPPEYQPQRSHFSSYLPALGIHRLEVVLAAVKIASDHVEG